jgi:hypothetical protein
MQKAIFLFLIISFILSSCGVHKDPENINLFEVDEIIPIETVDVPETTTKPPDITENIITTTPPEIIPEPKQDEVIKNDSLEPFIVIGSGHDFFSGNYIIRVISLCGVVKRMEYEYGSEKEHHDIDTYRFANVLYNQINDDSIPLLFKYDKTPDDIIEILEIIDIAELDKNHYYGADNWMYYIIVGADENRRAEKVGSRWGDFGDTLGSNELTRAINEYLETTSRTAVE